MNSAQVERVFDLISRGSTNQQIGALLKSKKEAGAKDVQYSGSAPELLKKLKKAHYAGAVSEQELLQLMIDGEECGNQHIFFFRFDPVAHPQYTKTTSLRTKLLASLGGKETDLPLLDSPQDQRTLVDIRLDPLPSEEKMLVAKWYSYRYVERHTGEDEIVNDNGRKVVQKQFERVPTRIMSLVRLHPMGLLEIRVPTGQFESRKICLEELELVWADVQSVLKPAHFEPMCMRGAMKHLRDHASKRHRLSTSQMSNGFARAEFNPAVEGQAISNEHALSMANYKHVEKSDIYWTHPERKDDEIRCQVGLYASHGVRIGAQLTQRVLDYIVYRWWEFRDCKP